jgi:hypothetical protein
MLGTTIVRAVNNRDATNIEDVVNLAMLVHRRNEIDSEIAKLIGRPAMAGHIGEFIASRVFDIELCESAVQKGIDGFFRSGPLAGKSVNIKLYGRKEGLLDIREDAVPDYYLVLTGPALIAMSSKGGHRPTLISSVFLFEGSGLVAALLERGVKVGVATSVRKHHWDACELHPVQRCTDLVLSDEQRQMLAMFV